MPDYAERSHRFLFQWHCRNFCNFQRHLSGLELAYLESCFRVASAGERVEPSRAHYSYYAYSHRVDGEKVNSSRLAFGSVTSPDAIREDALAVLEERGVAPPAALMDHGSSLLYGLGWDVEERQFKVYFRVLDMATIEVPELLSLAELPPGEGIVSYTYRDGELLETKVYLYPPPDPGLPQGSSRQTLMVTDRRGVVPQYDVAAPEDWAARLSAPGRQILARYRGIGRSLDTVAFQDENRYTLYFPREPL